MNSIDLHVVGAVFSRYEASTSPEILAFQRAGPDLGAGRWEFPGGKIKPSENPQQALSREILEELGINVEIKTDLGALFEPNKGFREFHFPTRKIGLRLFHVQPVHWDFHMLDHQALVWVNEVQAQKLAWLEADRPWLADIFKFLREQD